MNRRRAVFLFWIFLLICCIQNFGNPKCHTYPKKNYHKDKEEIIKLEKIWLKHLHNKTALDTILAPDFVHVLPQGVFINKAQQIDWVVSHPMKSGYSQKFDSLNVRIYNDSAIVNGIVLTNNKEGKLIGKSIFTDIFIKRQGKWQAVNAQENSFY